MRTIVDLPEEDIQALDLLAKRSKLSRAELVRRSVTAYIEKEAENNAITHDIFGLYSDVFTQDALEIERNLRGEWDERESHTATWGLNEPVQSPYKNKDGK